MGTDGTTLTLKLAVLSKVTLIVILLELQTRVPLGLLGNFHRNLRPPAVSQSSPLPTHASGQPFLFSPWSPVPLDAFLSLIPALISKGLLAAFPWMNCVTVNTHLEPNTLPLRTSPLLSLLQSDPSSEVSGSSPMPRIPFSPFYPAVMMLPNPTALLSLTATDFSHCAPVEDFCHRSHGSELPHCIQNPSMAFRSGESLMPLLLFRIQYSDTVFFLNSHLLQFFPRNLRCSCPSAFPGKECFPALSFSPESPVPWEKLYLVVFSQ